MNEDHDRDAYASALLATGHLYDVLWPSGLNPTAITIGGEPTNVIEIAPHWLTARYKITVERIPDDE